MRIIIVSLRLFFVETSRKNIN